MDAAVDALAPREQTAGTVSRDAGSPPIRVVDVAVSASFRTRILELLPALADARWLRLFSYVMLSPRLCEETGFVRAPYAVLGWIAGASKAARQRKFNGGGFLQEAQEGPFPGLELTPYSVNRGRSRNIKSLGLSLEVTLAVEAEMSRPPPVEGRVFFISGRKASDRTRVRKREEEKAERVAQERLKSHRETGERDGLRFPNECYVLAEKLNCLPRNRFSASVDRGIAEGYRMVRAYPDPRKRAAVFGTLRATEIAPRPLYKLSTERNSVRLFGDAPSLLYLPKAIRRVLTEGWIECDLRSAQLAINAALWKVPEMLQRLSDSTFSIWESAATVCGVDTSEPEWPAVKDAFKKGLYAFLYGMDEANARGTVTRLLKGTRLASEGSEPARRFMSLPFMTPMVEARDRRLAEIEDAGGAEDCFGRFVPTTERVSEKSILAQLAQAEELRLLLPAVGFLERRRDLSLTLWQHDGFSVASSDASKRDGAVRSLCKVVDAHADSLGFPTCLETEVNEPN